MGTCVDMPTNVATHSIIGMVQLCTDTRVDMSLGACMDRWHGVTAVCWTIMTNTKTSVRIDHRYEHYNRALSPIIITIITTDRDNKQYNRSLLRALSPSIITITTTGIITILITVIMTDDYNGHCKRSLSPSIITEHYNRAL